ncbi:hypothetical protein AVEN_235964-1 [Araneus ventricosus]|uniref:Uncharacterized protein n=1 Tax=Araneus ventricosus TaxID=182803 RepID=A0A4Y2S1Y2_ARAVE|nr:hypothetical protein AVEN_235964-1 [Araneus ventricosus]
MIALKVRKDMKVKLQFYSNAVTSFNLLICLQKKMSLIPQIPRQQFVIYVRAENNNIVLSLAGPDCLFELHDEGRRSARGRGEFHEGSDGRCYRFRDETGERE